VIGSGSRPEATSSHRFSVVSATSTIGPALDLRRYGSNIVAPQVSEDTFASFDNLRSFLDERYNLIHQENGWSIWRFSDLSGSLVPVNLVRP